MSHGRSYGVIDLVRKYYQNCVKQKHVQSIELSQTIEQEDSERNIVIIGDGVCIKNLHQRYSFKDIINNISIFNLDPEIKLLALKCLHKELSDNKDVYKDVEYGEKLKPLLNAIDSYLERNKNNYLICEKLNKDEFKNAVSMLYPEDIYRTLFEDKPDDFQLIKGVSLISIGRGVSSHFSALIIPYIIEKMKHFNNPTLIIDSLFFRNYCDNNFADEYFKISNEFHSKVRKICFYNKPQPIEYIEYTSDMLPKILVDYISKNIDLNIKNK